MSFPVEIIFRGDEEALHLAFQERDHFSKSVALAWAG